MFGIQSLKDMHEWASEQFGPGVAKALSALVLLAIVSACIALIGLAATWVWPVIKATWSLFPGTPPVVITWIDVLPGLIAILVVGLLGYRLYGQLKSLTLTVNIIREWLAEPLEQRLKAIETTAAHVEWVDETHASVQEQLESIRKRLKALEDHTGLYDLARIMAEQSLAAMKAQTSDPAPNNSLQQALEVQKQTQTLGATLVKLLMLEPPKRRRKPSDFIPPLTAQKPDSDK